jgi:hypothetical protein
MSMFALSNLRATLWSYGLVVVFLALFAAGPIGAFAATDATDVPGAPSATSPLTVCENQTYALCLTARCRVYNGVSYCQCDVKHGDSVSIPLDYRGKDVCDVNAAGKGNGYMVSTFSLPKTLTKGGDEALYTCPAETSTGAYAQCDGGICFRSTQDQEFPGLGKIKKDQIVCSCPVTTADPSTAKTGYQIVGPYPCQKSFFKYCKGKVANDDTGSTIYVGAPTGSARLSTKTLYGKVPPLNHCE